MRSLEAEPQKTLSLFILTAANKTQSIFSSWNEQTESRLQKEKELRKPAQCPKHVKFGWSFHFFYSSQTGRAVSSWASDAFPAGLADAAKSLRSLCATQPLH